MQTIRHTTPPTARSSSRRSVLLCGVAYAVLCVVLGSSLTVAADPPPGYVVIASPNTKLRAVDRELVTRVFLKTTLRWENGDPVHPVDLPPSSPVRKEFSERVLNRSVPAIRSYWLQRIFAGRDVPPPELASDEAVVRYVTSTSGAIGYVSTRAALGNAVVISVE